ncbi:hypothetical protein BBK14_23455 [Parafrankia soli]|uniref:Uncharacterized protein n=1 Tax=Parafrankia soli TaxID=2599596 RepID=A0A1S1PTA4_9ACTN|nr:hypothetical protein [Parafrankia soli]OHV24145.1 hypothetical protein BBK14_23455 [Parafrankia soli]
MAGHPGDPAHLPGPQGRQPRRRVHAAHQLLDERRRVGVGEQVEHRPDRAGRLAREQVGGIDGDGDGDPVRVLDG